MIYIIAFIEGLTNPDHLNFKKKILLVAKARAKELRMPLVKFILK